MSGIQNYPEEINLENCSKEPIHIIGKTQEHGLFLTCDRKGLMICQVGKNAGDIVGVPAEDLLGRRIDILFSEPDIDKLMVLWEKGELSVNFEVEVGEKRFILLAHLSGEQCIIEIEPLSTEIKVNLQANLSRILDQLNERKSISELCHSAAGLTKDLFGYDRIMIYRFDAEWNGEVVAENKLPEFESWLGLHYPATDIPEQSRKMFHKNKVRIISNVDYNPVPITPEISPVTGVPLDLSNTSLRAVSPIHIEYLNNMKVGASLTVAIIVKDKLWGLLACHHMKPKFLDFYGRESCRFLVQVLSTQIALKEAREFLEQTNNTQKLKRDLIAQMEEGAEIPVALTEGKVKFTDLVDCGGGAIYFDDKWYTTGEVPNPQDIEDLFFNFLIHQEESIFSTSNLAEVYSKAASYKEMASGVLSLRIAENKFLIWFRPEVVQTVSWGGNPNRKAFFNEEKQRISPRKSFDKWIEKVSETSHPWKDFDFGIARAIRENISYLVLAKQSQEIEQLNEELLQVNKDLELFSYGLSHDLRAPLRGIRGYLDIISEDFSGAMEPEGKKFLKMTSDLSVKMDDLIDNILAYSRLSHSGRMDFEEIDVDELIQEVLEFSTINGSYPGTRVVIEKTSLKIAAERRMIFQVWANLVNNALKYSAEKESPEVIIGSRKISGKTVFFVRDNGIGIKNEFKDKIFETFSRLVGSRYKGSGIGLAIVKKIVEKHDGQIWVESEPGIGSTFYFYLTDKIQQEK